MQLAGRGIRRNFVDATGITALPTGLGKYCYHLLKELIIKEEYDFTVLIQESLPASHPLFCLKSERTRFLYARIPVIGPLRDVGILRLSRIINQHDLYHCLSSYFPAFGIKIPSIVTIHDLKYLLFPNFLKNSLKNKYYRWIIKRGIKNARKIIAVSEATKKDIKKIGGAEEKIKVIYEAVTISSGVREPRTSIFDMLNGESFLLYVGENRPHKNITRMIEAYQRVLIRLGESCPLFVFVGMNFDALRKKYRTTELADKLIFAGSVPDNELSCLYRQALALVYPSLYEGFGLPIIEAMSMGTPVITSNCSSMAEVAGSAALLIDSYSIDELFEAMVRLAVHQQEREKLKVLGLRRAADFSWERAAHMTAEVYNEVARKL